jgi:hypothetical protein
VDSGQGGIPDLAAMLDGYEFVDARMALIRAADGWPIVHGEGTLDSAGPARIRTWRYAEETFLDRRLPGRLVAGLLRGEPQDLDGLKVMTPAPMPGCTFQRLAGQAEWSHLTTPWPRTEWSISSSDQMPNRQDRLLVGDGPAFLNFEAAYSGPPRCRIPEFTELGKKIRRHLPSIHATLDHGLSNGLIESVNTKIRVITRMAFGFHNPTALIALAMLALGGLRPPPPGR